MKNTIVICLIIFFFSSFLVSCNKENESSPEINFLLPIQNQAFSFGDTIRVKAEIEDEVNVKSVSLSLVNSDKVIVSPQQNYTFDDSEITLSGDILLQNAQLSSGSYYVNVIARNDNNSRSVFLPIQYSGLQRQWKGLFLITKGSDLQTNVMLLDTSSLISLLITLQGDYLSSDMNSVFQRLIVSGYKTGGLNAIDVDVKIIDWTIPNQSTNDNPYFYSLLVTNNRVYSAIRNSEIRAFDFSGSLAYSYSLPGQRYAEKLLVTTDRLYAQTIDISGSTKRLIQFYTGSSLSITDHTIAMNIKSWFWMDGKLLVLGNTGNTGRIYSYNYINNTFTLLNNTNSEIVNACPISITEYLVSCADGIYTYTNTSANTLNLVIPHSGAKNLVFDPVQQRVFFHKSNSLFVYSYPDFQNIYEYTSASEILNIHLWYNR